MKIETNKGYTYIYVKDKECESKFIVEIQEGKIYADYDLNEELIGIEVIGGDNISVPNAMDLVEKANMTTKQKSKFHDEIP